MTDETFVSQTQQIFSWYPKYLGMILSNLSCLKCMYEELMGNSPGATLCWYVNEKCLSRNENN